MAVGGALLADLGQMQAHGLGVDDGQDERGGSTAAGADRAEQVGRLMALVPGLTRTGATRRPLSGELALLADAGLVLEPDLKPLAVALRANGRRDQLGQFFLNSACRSGSAWGCTGRAEIREKPSERRILPMPRSW